MSTSRSSCLRCSCLSFCHQASITHMGCIVFDDQRLHRFSTILEVSSTCGMCILSHVLWPIITGSGLDDWIYWHSFTITIITAHNQWLSKTCSIPYWTTSAFPTAVTDLVLIYELVTSSDSVARWLTLHSWTQLSYDWISLLGTPAYIV
jgi:hypothetical protein